MTALLAWKQLRYGFYTANNGIIMKSALAWYLNNTASSPIWRYCEIQLETKDITTRLRGINHINLSYYSPKPRSDVFCFKLNFNISKLGYYPINESPKILVSQLLRRLQKGTFQHNACVSSSVKQAEDIYLLWITTRLKRENQLRLRYKILRLNFMKSRRINQT